MGSFKQLALRALTGRGLTPLYRIVMRRRATILMLHRFADPETGVEGHDPALLRAALAWLRRERYRLVDLQALLDGLRAGEPGWDRAVAFTIDDGYRDQVAIGGQVFAEFDCPATTFVTTGFLDGQLWFWWDRIAHVFASTRRPAIAVELETGPVRYERGAAGYTAAQADFTERCKHLRDVYKHAAIDRLAASAEVALPAAPPTAYAPMSWDELRAAESRGMRFGPHTVTHPILARTPDDQSRHEITESWRRLRQQTPRATPVFCYPNGQLDDFSTRDIGHIRAAGISAAVVGVPGYVQHAALTASADAPYLVPRFGYTEDLPMLRQYVSGLEALKNVARGSA